MNQETELFTPLEIEERILNISDVEIAKLIMIFKSMGCKNRIGWDEFELLNHVVERVLEGRRKKWRKDLDILTFLSSAGRSLIDNEEKKREKTTDNHVEIDEFQKSSSSNDENELLAMNSSTLPDEVIEITENNNANLQLYEKITAMFKDNESILCILKQKYEDVKKAMILKICSISEDEYISANNKIKYKLKKEYPHGYENEIGS